MPIHNRALLVDGATLRARHQGCEVLAERIDGKIVVEGDDTAYGSVSAAAKAITGASTNGWKFWMLTNVPDVSEVQAPLIEEPSADEDKPVPKKAFVATGQCDNTYHGKGRNGPSSIATLTRIKGAENTIGEVHERCYDDVVNQLTYWQPFWKIEALDEEELASAERKAALARQGSGQRVA